MQPVEHQRTGWPSGVMTAKRLTFSGDVVQLDRHVNDPADLIVGDKVVARGEVVLINGNFGLRVTEVAAPRKRLETIRCLF